MSSTETTETTVDAVQEALGGKYSLGMTVTGRVVHLIDFDSERNMVNYRDGDDLTACSMVGDYEHYTGEVDELLDNIRGSQDLVCSTCMDCIRSDYSHSG